MILNKIQKDMKYLAMRLLLAEVVFGLIISGINYLFDLPLFYKTVTGGNFWDYEFFSMMVFFVLELFIILLVVSQWQKKFLRLSREDRLTELLEDGEGEGLEFKSTFRWDLKENRYNKELEKTVIKSVAGFLNSDGGILLVGVGDNKEIVGLEDDFRTLPRTNKDSWENHFNQVVKSYLGLAVRRLIRVEFSALNKKPVAIIEVKKSERPVYFRDGETENFFVRTGNSTNGLSISAATEYIENHWSKKKSRIGGFGRG